MNRDVFHLPIDVFKKWVKDSPNTVEWIQPQGIGEPLMYPDLIEALAYSKKRGLKTMFYTNATLLTRSMSERLLEVGLNDLTYSIDGFNTHSFGTRIGASWKKTVSNIEVFQQLRDKGGYGTHTLVRATITKRNRFRVIDFIEFWKGRVDEVGMMPLVNFPTPEQLDKTPYAMGKGFKCYHIFDLQKPAHITHSTPVCTVLNNGNVVLCCQDWFSDYVCGNLYEEKPNEVFNSDRMNKIREAMVSGFRYPLLCEYCRLGKQGKSHQRNLFRLGFLAARKLISSIDGVINNVKI